jgi:hypothetical protein
VVRDVDVRIFEPAQEETNIVVVMNRRRGEVDGLTAELISYVDLCASIDERFDAIVPP